MTQILTPGRWRGLQTTSTDEGVFCILAFDQRGSYKKMLPEGTDYETAVQIKDDIVISLSKQATAVLLDPDYGFSPALKMSSSCGLLISSEKSGYTGDSTYRRTEFDPDWTIAKIKEVGASAVKLMVYYHPETGELAEELEAMTKRVIDECHALDMAIFLEPMSYSRDENIKKESAAFAATKPHIVKETARRLSALGPDVLKLEFPHDAAFNSDHAAWQEACEAISEVSTVPWVLLSAGVDFETFVEQTEVACKGGASGFLAGRAIWKEAATMTPEDRAKFLEETATPRIKQLIDISKANAHPWTKFYQMMSFSEGWYRQ